MKFVIKQRLRVIQHHEQERTYTVDEAALWQWAEEAGWDPEDKSEDLLVDSVLPAYAEEMGWLGGFSPSRSTLIDTEEVEDDPGVEIA